jgi:hypothetical protein
VPDAAVAALDVVAAALGESDDAEDAGGAVVAVLGVGESVVGAGVGVGVGVVGAGAGAAVVAGADGLPGTGIVAHQPAPAAEAAGAAEALPATAVRTPDQAAVSTTDPVSTVIAGCRTCPNRM